MPSNGTFYLYPAMFITRLYHYLSALGLRIFALLLVAALFMAPQFVNVRNSVVVPDEYGAPPSPMCEEEEVVHQKSSSNWSDVLSQFPPEGGYYHRPGTSVRPHTPPVSEVPHLPPWAGKC